MGFSLEKVILLYSCYIVTEIEFKILLRLFSPFSSWTWSYLVFLVCFQHKKPNSYSRKIKFTELSPLYDKWKLSLAIIIKPCKQFFEEKNSLIVWRVTSNWNKFRRKPTIICSLFPSIWTYWLDDCMSSLLLRNQIIVGAGEPTRTWKYVSLFIAWTKSILF